MVCPSPFRVHWERAVKEVMASPEFGELRCVAVVSCSGANRDATQVTWRERVEYSGLNILQVGIFAETLNAWCGEFESLAAETQIPLTPKRAADRKSYEVRIPQIVSIAGRLRNGAVVSELHTGLAITNQGTITLHGSQGSCVVAVLDGRVEFFTASDPTQAVYYDAMRDPWLVEFEFLTAVRAARRGEPWQVRPNFAEASRYMLKMQALHDSARTNSTVRLDQYEA
jgi:hypothetical protein